MRDEAMLFCIKMVVFAVLAVVIKAGVAMAHHSIAWWAAALIAAAVTFGGWLILDGDWID